MTGEGQKKNFQSDRNILYFDSCVGYTGVYIWQNSVNCTLKMCLFYCL